MRRIPMDELFLDVANNPRKYKGAPRKINLQPADRYNFSVDTGNDRWCEPVARWTKRALIAGVIGLSLMVAQKACSYAPKYESTQSSLMTAYPLL